MVLQSKKNVSILLDLLSKEYPNAMCGLNYSNELELTIALILAAQCTDKMVNKTIPILFKKYNTIYDLKDANISDIENIVKSCGFYKNKSKNILLTVNKIVNDYNGIVPNTMEQLTLLHGIGRKSSNIILQECFNITEGIAVDTHVSRLSKRIGLTKTSLPITQEKELMKIIDKYYYNKINHIFVNHGRKICTSRNPKCDLCVINNICKKYI